MKKALRGEATQTLRSAAAQCIVIGPVCGWVGVCLWVGVCVGLLPR